MPIEIACGNCGNSFGVEAGWAGLIVQCPFCQTAVQVPDEVAEFADEPNEKTPAPPDVPPEKVVRRTAERSKKSAKKEPGPDPIQLITKSAKPAPEVPVPSMNTAAVAVSSTAVVVEPTVANTLVADPAPTQSASLALPEWTVPPVCLWMLESNAAQEIRVSVRVGLTTINYHGQKMVLRDQPEAANWYGRLTFAMSVMILALLLTWLYYVYR
ncbi:MAG: hypothetical protein Q8M16_16365 [Pirellulaceae bacterium]|nr:hypothetical protein [Pirellulaceae bacterium]